MRSSPETGSDVARELPPEHKNVELTRRGFCAGIITALGASVCGCHPAGPNKILTPVKLAPNQFSFQHSPDKTQITFVGPLPNTHALEWANPNKGNWQPVDKNMSFSIGPEQERVYVRAQPHLEHVLLEELSGTESCNYSILLEIPKDSARENTHHPKGNPLGTRELVTTQLSPSD